MPKAMKLARLYVRRFGPKALDVLAFAAQQNCQIILPSDVQYAPELTAGAKARRAESTIYPLIK